MQVGLPLPCPSTQDNIHSPVLPIWSHPSIAHCPLGATVISGTVHANLDRSPGCLLGPPPFFPLKHTLLSSSRDPFHWSLIFLFVTCYWYRIEKACFLVTVLSSGDGKSTPTGFPSTAPRSFCSLSAYHYSLLVFLAISFHSTNTPSVRFASCRHRSFPAPDGRFLSTVFWILWFF